MISADPKIVEKGSEVATRQIELGKKWEEVHIITFKQKEKRNTKKEIRIAAETVLASNVWAYPVQSVIKLLVPFKAIRLGRFLIEKRGITHITTQDPFLTGMSGINLKKQFPQVKLEIQLHTDIGAVHYPYKISNKLRKSLALSYLPQADSIRVVSERSKSYLVHSLGIDSGKIEVRPIPVDVEKIKNAPITIDLHTKYPQFKKIVLMVSRLEKEKNIELALNAWPKVISKIPDAGLIIVGKGSEKNTLEKLAAKLGLVGAGKDSVIFEGWADQSTLASYYKTSDVYLLTSLYEGYGMTLVEAHAAGTQIVSTDVGVAPELGATIADWTIDDVSEKIVYSLGIHS